VSPRLTQRVVQSALKLRGFQSRFVPTPLGRMHLLEARGKGTLPTIVVLHGLSSAGFHYYPFLRRLRPRVRHVVAMDLPGHGLSDVPSGGLDARALSDGILATFESLLERHEKVALFGNSLGGFVALRYALLRPERVCALVLFAPGGAAMTERELEQLRRVFRLENHRDALAFIDRIFARPPRLRHLFAWGARRGLRLRHMQQLLASVGESHLLSEEELSTLKVPTLLLWGEHDRILPRSNLDFFRRALPSRARIEVHTGVGHTPFLEGAHSTAERTLAFLEQVEVGGRSHEP
jgi:pimeloyl-ACP methyl ester carboxylesterase